jgi:hypothetical protein
MAKEILIKLLTEKTVSHSKLVSDLLMSPLKINLANELSERTRNHSKILNFDESNLSLNEIYTQTLTEFFTGKTSNFFLIGVCNLIFLLSPIFKNST